MNSTQSKRKLTRGKLGSYALLIAVLALAGATALPTNYVIQRPGSAVNTLGEVNDANGNEVPLIQVHDAETYPTDGALYLTTVWVRGSRENRPTWLELGMAWFDKSQAVRTIDEVFPPGVTDEETKEQNAQMMSDSKTDAAAAALNYLDFETNPQLEVTYVVEGEPAFGHFEIGDLVLTANGQDARTISQLRAAVADSKGAEVAFTVERGGEVVTLNVAPREIEDASTPSWLLGVGTQQTYELPIDITLQLDNIGGPSAGMMFALGIIDTMSPGSMTGGAQIAGTGTIDGSGAVGPIGGIRQKLFGALDAGAEYFLAPVSNCNEVVGHVPDGLQVIATATLDEAVAAVEQIGSGGSTDDLPTCEMALEALDQ